MTFTVLIGITHWNLVALHKTIDYLFPTPAAPTRGPRGVCGDRSAAGGQQGRSAPSTPGQGGRVQGQRPWHTPGAASASPPEGGTSTGGGPAPTSPVGCTRGGLRGAHGAGRARLAHADDHDV